MKSISCAPGADVGCTIAIHRRCRVPTSRRWEPTSQTSFVTVSTAVQQVNATIRYNNTGPLAVDIRLRSRLLSRPTYLSADLCFTADSFFFFFFRRLISELAERNSTKIGHMLGTNCGLKTHVQNLGCPLPLQIGAQKPPFWMTSQLSGNFNGLYLRNETWHRKSSGALTTTRVSYIVPKCHWLWSTNGFKLDRHFYSLLFCNLSVTFQFL